MKIFLIPLFILSSFQFVIAQDVKQNQLIVYGDAIIKAQTDIAIFTFAYKGVGASLDIAVNNAKNKIKTQNSTSNCIIKYVHFYNCGKIKFIKFNEDRVLIPQNFNI